MPDVTPYIDLRIYDKDPQDIFDTAVLDLQTKLPEWIPREGNVEVTLMEALALIVSETIFAINRLPSSNTEILLKLFGVVRDSGAPPTVTLEFTMSGTMGYTIAAGTTARLELPGGLPPIVFTTDVELVIAPGDSTGVVAATGDRFTDDANNVAPGTVLELLDAIFTVDEVALDSIVAGGREPETDAVYFSRALTRFQRLTEALVLPRHFSAYCLDNPAVAKALALDNWDGSGGVPGDDPGHITVAVYGVGSTISAPLKAQLEAEMEAIAAANLDIHVVDPTITTVNVTAAVKAKSGFSTSAVQTAIEDMLTAYLDPASWSWSGTVRRFELVSLIDQVEGVDYVSTLTTPAADVTLTGNAPLADAGTFAITVT